MTSTGTSIARASFSKSLPVAIRKSHVRHEQRRVRRPQQGRALRKVDRTRNAIALLRQKFDEKLAEIDLTFDDQDERCGRHGTQFTSRMRKTPRSRVAYLDLDQNKPHHV